MMLSLSTSKNRTQMLFVAALMLLLSFASFGINLNGPLIWDDAVWVKDNLAVTHSHPGWIWIHKYSASSYYPLTLTTFWVEYHLWGQSPIGYRIVNILLHTTSAFLLWRLLKQLKIPGALLAAIVWAVHPIQVETVVWITERKNTLSGVFFFASLLMWLKVISAPAMQRQEWKNYAWVLVLFLLSLLAKTATVFLPIAALAMVLLALGKISRRHLLLSIPMFAIALIMGVVTVLVEHYDASGGYGPAWDLSWAQRFILSGHVFWFYLTKIFWPVDLVAVYPKWDLNAAEPLEYLWPVSALLLIAAVAAIALRWKKVGPLCAIMVYLAGIFPVIGYMKFFTQLYTYVADHYVYLPSVAIIILAAAVLTQLWQGLRAHLAKIPQMIAPAFCGVLAISLTCLSFGYAKIYRDNFALWEEVLRVNPKAFIAYSCLGYYSYVAGYHGKAVEYYEKSLSMFRDARVLANAAMLLEAHGQTARAKAYYEEAAAAKVYNSDVYKQLAKMEMAAGNTSRAIEVCRMGLAVDPEWPILWYGLGMIYRQTQQNDKALDAFEHYLKLMPKAADVYMEIGTIYLERGDIDRAINYFREGKNANPEYLGVRRSLVSALLQKGLTAEAAQEAAAADQLEIRLREKAATVKRAPAALPAAPRLN